MPIVGTAGHVDHGKSTLVQALTGTDPDRWAEEKARGLTIDLGFAWAVIRGHDVGFVDVPGHERFIKNMLAGVGALDCSLLVVAADSGWMPQTEEHASVLDLLEVDAGIIALTRIDLAEADTVEMSTYEIIEEVAGTRLEAWPIIPVSPVTGEGLPALREAIGTILDARPAPDTTVPPRLWVDRTFTIAGAGQVLTGTLASGSISLGDTVTVLPHGEPAKVRGIHHHGGEVDTAVAGDRTALNLPGAGEAVDRGALVTTEGGATTATRFVLRLRPTRAVGAIPDRGAFHLHIGTASRPARLRRIGGDFFIATLDVPCPVVVGDRVIIRDSGRKAVVGGGRVLDADPAARPDRGDLDVLDEALDGTRDDVATALLGIRGRIDRDVLAAMTSGGRPERAVAVGTTWMSEAVIPSITAQALAAVESFHAEHPTRPGHGKAQLASRLRIDLPTLEAVIDRSDALVSASDVVRLASFANELSATEQQRWETARAGLEASFNVPRMGAIDVDTETLHFLIRQGDLVRVGDDLVYTRAQVATMLDKLPDLGEAFTVAEFRDHFGMARRQAVPTLEWLDATGVTRRSGDVRSLR